MNKKEIIEKIADESRLTQKDIGKFLDSFIVVVTKTLKQGGNIMLVGFGQFMLANRAARSACGVILTKIVHCIIQSGATNRILDKLVLTLFLALSYLRI